MQTIADHVRWTAGYGLGLQLLRDGERILAGHGGSMPGFIAGVYVAPADKVGVALLTNSSTARLGTLAQKLVAATVDALARAAGAVARRRAAARRRRAAARHLVHGGRPGRLPLARRASSRRSSPTPPTGRSPPCFARESADRWRVVSGWEHGELLRIEQDRMVLAGYPVTRTPGVWV